MIYFGQTTQTATNSTGGGGAVWNATTYTCPGSGTQNVVEMSMYGSYVSGSGNIRIGIYNSAGTTKVGEGNAEKAMSGTNGWQGHLGAAECGNTQLVGGTSYMLLAALDAASNLGYVSGSQCVYKASDYTGGLPAAIPTKDGDLGVNLSLRCGVEPAAGYLTRAYWQDINRAYGGL